MKLRMNRNCFDEEVEGQIKKGWLIPCNGIEHQFGVANGGLILLMAVVQENKEKTRPVLDFRELTEFIENHPWVDAAVCDETMRRQRCLQEPIKLVYLKSAYLQIRTDESCGRFNKCCIKQAILFDKVGFWSKMRTQNYDHVQRGTDSYVDDIIVNKNVVMGEEVVTRLCKYGLETKPPEELQNNKDLGLHLFHIA